MKETTSPFVQVRRASRLVSPCLDDRDKNSTLCRLDRLIFLFSSLSRIIKKKIHALKERSRLEIFVVNLSFIIAR